MKDENTLMLTGRITKDPEITSQQAEKMTVKFNLAIHVNDEKTYFVQCTAYDATGSFIYDKFRKGDPVFMRGSIRQTRYQENDGKMNSYIDIVTHRLNLLGTFANRNYNKKEN